MKKNILLLVLLLVSASVYSQSQIEGSFTLPETEKYLALDWDFSETIFDRKHNEKEWAALNGEKEWAAAKSEALGLVLQEMNGKMQKSRITVIKTESGLPYSYILYICPVKYNKKGDNVSFYILKEKATGKEIARCKIKGDGGHYGTLANLLGDGFEEAARDMGGYLRIKNKKKK